MRLTRTDSLRSRCGLANSNEGALTQIAFMAERRCDQSRERFGVSEKTIVTVRGLQLA